MPEPPLTAVPSLIAVPPNLPTHATHMKLLLAILAGLALAAYILLLADGPSLLEIIDNPKF
jgi:hypothetical protein